MEQHSETLEPTQTSRLIVVSNRLPITIQKDADKKSYAMKKSSGGLVSGMAGCLKGRDHIWYGWPGLELPSDQIHDVCETLDKEYSARPIFVPDKLADKHYNGFSNEILWPLLHYHPGEATFDESIWEAYQKVNQIFAERLMEDVHDGDTVWVHDYHLMLLPMLLRRLLQSKDLGHVKIGWFLHTPFPSAEVYRTLPCRVQLLEGVLAADLVGFHTYDYAKHFLSACHRTCAAKVGSKFIEHNGRKTAIGAFPIGIDPDKFASGINNEEAQEYFEMYKKRFEGCVTIIGCDRLDYIKGVPHKLHAFQHMLEAHPELVGKVKLVQIAVPSREDVPEYQALKRSINELTGLINGTFGSIDFNPIHLKHTNVGHNELMALFAVSDICLVSSTRDGMNLVAYEYVACQAESHGVLVLSEFAGCAQSFASGAVVCNPWNTEQLAEGMYEAITMSAKEKDERHQRLWDYVHKYTSSWWGNAFLDKLDKAHQHILGLYEEDPELCSRKIITEALDKERDMAPKVPRKKVAFDTRFTDIAAHI